MKSPRSRSVLTAIALSVWAATVCAAVLPFFAGHFLVFNAAAAGGTSVVRTTWSMTHVLGQRCFCSQTVVPYLLERGPVPETHEKVLFLGRDFPAAAALRARGFEVEVRDPASLGTDAVTAVPFLVITRPGGELAWTGGYAEHRVTAGTAMKDVATLQRLRAELDSTPLPVIGCAVSPKYQALLDPLGVKTMGGNR